MNEKVFYRDFRRSYRTVAYGKGIYLWDTEGKRYLDGCGGNVAVNVGYGVDEIIEAIYSQMKKTSFAHTSRFTSEVSTAAFLDQLGAQRDVQVLFCIRGL